MPRTGTGVDVGLRSVKAVRGYTKGGGAGGTFVLTGFDVRPVTSTEVSDGWEGLELSFAPKNARVGLTGRDVNVRYVRVPRVPDWQLRKLMRFEVAEIGGQSGAGVASDFNLLPELPEIEGEDVVLLALARESLLETHAAGLAAAGGSLDAFTPNAIALYNAWVRFGAVQDEVVLLANIGLENTDVVITRGPDLIFARNLSGGSRLFDEALQQALDVSPTRARELKEQAVDLSPNARFKDATAERASRAAQTAAGQLLSLLQSAVLFAKSQVKISGLQLDRVLLCGGGSRLAGLSKYLAGGLSVPVESFDPFRVVDASKLSPEAQAELERHKLSAVVALGLAATAADPASYSIEILPAAMRKKREFVGGTLWLIAAGVLALGYLGADVWRKSNALERESKRAATLEQQYRRASGTQRRAEELIVENARLSQLARALELEAGSGAQLARAVGWLSADLPEEFWLTQLSSEVRSDPELGVQRGQDVPIVSVVGKAREGTNSLAALYQGFLHELRARLPAGVVPKEKLAPSGAHFTLDVTLYAPKTAPAQPSEEGAR